MTTCRECGQPIAERADSDGATQSLLRVSNVAEAGYLADRLREGGYASRVAPLESFDAITGAWSMGYAVLVEPETASEAAEFLHASLAETNDASSASHSGSFQESVQRTTNLWSFMGVLVAAVVGGLLIARPADPPQPQAEQKRLPLSALGRRLDRIGAPLIAVAADGSTHRLSIDRQQQRWVLDTDANADGRFEKRDVFSAP